jgi:acetylornithine deacetylase/succinyl-diaminopimelate desuccinylase-like protein
MTNLDNYLKDHLNESIEELSKYCRQPSVSAQQLGLKECAELTANLIAKRGFQVEIIPTGGASVVIAEKKGKSGKTILFYNHYDVQPAEPLELWDSPPFEPSLREGKLYGRGVSDDKGHMVSRLFAIDAILNEVGDLPCTIKFCVEGEEETSSVHLHEFMENNFHKLTADACIWEFGGVDHREVPLQYLGLRGICYVELSVQTANQDVHSGLGGSIFPNAAWRLVWALNSLKDPDERILLPGFYDAVKEPTAKDKELMALMPDMAEEYKNRFHLKNFLGDLKGGVELNIAEAFRPTCTICGLTAGYQGMGSKTVQPCRASAKVDFRLVPDQTPEVVFKQLRQHLDENGFQDVEIRMLGGEAPAKTNPDDPLVALVVDTAKDVYKKPMQIIPLSGGSGPNHLFSEKLHIPIVTAGIGYPGSNGHAPNENIRVDLYLKGAQHIARILMAFGSEKV